jgi:hypothetical protein
MKNLSPRPEAATVLRNIKATLLFFVAGLLLTLPAHAQQPKPAQPNPAQPKPDAQSRELTHTNETTRVSKLPLETDRYALVIGVDKYKDPGINPLLGAGNDAKNLAEALRKFAGFKKEHIYTFTSDAVTDDQHDQPYGNLILEKLDQLKGRIPKNGMLLVAFAGHGIDQDGTAYLLPYDASTSMSALKKYAISVPELRSAITATGAGQVILILDACRDNPFATGGRGIDKEDNNMKQSMVDGFNFADRNSGINAFVTIYAARPGQRAWEDTKTKRGYFTSTLVEALEGAAKNENGEVTLDGVLNYVRNEVPKRVHSVRPDHLQEPWFNQDGFDGGKLVLSVQKPTVNAAANGNNAVGTLIAAPAAPTTGSLSYTSVPGARLRLDPVGGCGVAKDAVLAADKKFDQLSEIKPCDYDVMASREGYEPVKKRVKIIAGRVESLDLTMNLATFPVTVAANIPTGSVEYWTAGDATRRKVQLQDGKGTLPALPKGQYSYEVKTDDADFQSKTGTFNVPEGANLVVKLERTSTSLYSRDLVGQFDPADWSAPGLFVKGRFAVTITGSGITYLRDDKYQHYADFRMDVQSVRMLDGVAASFVVRAQDENNYYLVQLTGPKSDDPYKLRTYIVRDGKPALLRSVSFENAKDALTPQTQVYLTISMTGQNLSVTLHNNTGSGEDFNYPSSVLDPNNTFPKGALGFGSLKGEKFEIGFIQVCGAKCGGQQ